MADDALAKAAYDAHAAVFGMQGVLGWDELTPQQKSAWRAVARAVLEAAGYDELVNIARDAKLLLRHFCETCGNKPDCSECGWQGFGAKLQAALAKAGEGGVSHE